MLRGIPSRDTNPDYVNEEGVKWWRFDYATKALRTNNSEIGIPLPKAAAWLVEFPDKAAAYVITEDDQVLHDGQTLEGLFAVIDMLRKSRE